MTLRTASEGISYARSLESRLGALYEAIGKQWPELEEAVAPYRNYASNCIADVERTYYSVISDAIEGGFCFDLEPSDYPQAVPGDLPGHRDGAIVSAIEAEHVLCRFYENAADQSCGLMADIPRLFERIAKRRRAKLEELRALRGNKEV